jgi:hypothetical protein
VYYLCIVVWLLAKKGETGLLLLLTNFLGNGNGIECEVHTWRGSFAYWDFANCDGGVSGREGVIYLWDMLWQ